MKICFVTKMVFKDGGVSRVLSVVASQLAEKHDVTVATFEKPENEDRKKYNLSSKVKVDFIDSYYQKCYFRRFLHKINQKTGVLEKLKSEKCWNFVYLPRKMKQNLKAYISQNGFDIVIGVQGRLSYVLGSVADDISCKTMGWQHNSYEAYFEQPGKNYYWNQDHLFEKYLPKLDRYIVLNEHDEDLLRKKKGIDSVTIYNPRSFTSKEKAELDVKRFIGVGGLRKAKGFDLLIESFDLFAKRNQDWTLDIFGDGADRAMLQKMIDQRNLGERVKLRGVSGDIRTEMIHSSALLLSSRWEGMPMVVLEALETGLPTVSYDITAINPLVTDGVEGLIVKQFDTGAFAEAMLKMAEQDELRKELGRNAQKKAKKFSVEEVAQRWENLFSMM